MRSLKRVKKFGLHPWLHVHPAKANNKLAEINIVRFIFKVSLMNLLAPWPSAHFPEQLYVLIPVVQAKNENIP